MIPEAWPRAKISLAGVINGQFRPVLGSKECQAAILLTVPGSKAYVRQPHDHTNHRRQDSRSEAIIARAAGGLATFLALCRQTEATPIQAWATRTRVELL